MNIITLEKIDSTHTYLKNLIKKEGFTYPTCVVTSYQTKGIGSRGNTWKGIKGNLFFSFVLSKKDLPKDLELQSASIYFSYLLKEILSKSGSNIWLKWPNDFYLKNKKIGGTITTLTNDLLYCGIGLNLVDVSTGFGKLDINIDSKLILNEYFKSLEKDISWKQIFSLFQIEFKRSKKFKATIDNKKVLLENSILNDDGSIEINNKKVFSLR